MKTLLLSCSLFLLLSLSFFNEHTAKVRIGESSQITIAGKSNVNKFDCDYISAITAHEKEIKYKKVNNALLLENAKLNLKSADFDCGGSRINKDFEELLEVEKHPHIKIDFNSIEVYRDHYRVFAEITIADISENYNFRIIKNDNNRFSGEVKININDFGMEAPRKMMGLIVVDNHIDINFDLDLEIKA